MTDGTLAPSGTAGALAGQRWIVVADSPFLPADGGGEREHLGFLQAVARAGVLALLVVPGAAESDVARYQTELGDVPVVVVPRRTSPLMLLHPTQPYVVASRPAPGWLPARVGALAPGATGIVVFSYKSREIGEVLARGLKLPAVLRQHNREGAYHRSLAAGTSGPRSLALRWEALRIERDERRTGRAGWLAGTADISLADAEWRRGTGAHGVVHVPPFAIDLPASGEVVRRPADPPRVLFLGALDVTTNTDAIGWFLDEVWPRVSAGNDRAVFQVVGRGPGEELRRRLAAAPRTELAADVPAVRPYLEQAAVAVNPAVSGSGVNIKVVEYLDAAVPLVSTSLATRGLPLRAAEDLVVADEPAAFADAVLRLLADPAAAEAQAATGRAHVREILDPASGLARIAGLLAARATRA